MAIFEAMAMGLVPVGAHVGGQSELVTPECGFLIPHGPNELAEYTEALRRLVADYSLRRRMGLAARERVERLFPLSALGPRMAGLIDHACMLSRNAPRPAVGLGLGRKSAVQALEYTRLEQALGQLWMERESWRAQPRPHPTLDIPPATWRRRVARFARAKTAGLYRWGLDHGMTWLTPLKDRATAWAKRHGW